MIFPKPFLCFYYYLSHCKSTGNFYKFSLGLLLSKIGFNKQGVPFQFALNVGHNSVVGLIVLLAFKELL